MTTIPPTDTQAEKPLRPPAFYTVPANAASSRCKCGKTQYWILTQRGKRMPVDCDVEGGTRPIPPSGGHDYAGSAGRGVSHFATCPRADGFRRGHA